MLLPAAGTKRERCVHLSVGREPSSERRFARCEAKGGTPRQAVIISHSTSICRPIPGQAAPTSPFSAGRTRNAVRLLFPFTPRRVEGGFAKSFRPPSLCRTDGNFAQSSVPFPKSAARQTMVLRTQNAKDCALASWMSDSRARRACRPQAGQTTVLRTQNARAAPWQVGCQTAARSAPVTPRPDRRRFCAAKCQGNALASWMSDSRARRACHSQAEQTTALRSKMPGLCPGKLDVRQPRKARLSPSGRTDDGFANAKCQGYALASWMSDSRAKRACQACSSKRISS